VIASCRKWAVFWIFFLCASDASIYLKYRSNRIESAAPVSIFSICRHAKFFSLRVDFIFLESTAGNKKTKLVLASPSISIILYSFRSLYFSFLAFFNPCNYANDPLRFAFLAFSFNADRYRCLDISRMSYRYRIDYENTSWAHL